MPAKVRCLKCGDEIISKQVHDFITCNCGNISVDGGAHYVRYIGEALNDGSFQIWNDKEGWINAISTHPNYIGVHPETRISIVRNSCSLEHPMYVNIKDISTLQKVYSYDIEQDKFVESEIDSVIDNGVQQLERFSFDNDICHRGKISFGTENSLIAEIDLELLTFDKKYIPLNQIYHNHDIVCMKRYNYNNNMTTCLAKLLISHKYFEQIKSYTLKLKKYDNFVANGFVVKCIKGD